MEYYCDFESPQKISVEPQKIITEFARKNQYYGDPGPNGPNLLRQMTRSQAQAQASESPLELTWAVTCWRTSHMPVSRGRLG